MNATHQYLVMEGQAKDWKESIELCGQALAEKGYANLSFMEACLKREREFPTGLPCSIPVAIPHAQSIGVKEDSICFLRLAEPVRFYRMDDSEQYIETNLIFNLAVKNGGQHLEFLQKLMDFVTNEDNVRQCQTLPLEQIPAYLSQHLS